jgi:hypothetical protein
MQCLNSSVPSITVPCRWLLAGSTFISVQLDKRLAEFQIISWPTSYVIDSVTHLFSKSSVICTFIFSLIVPPQFVQSLVGTFKLTSFTAREALVFKMTLTIHTKLQKKWSMDVPLSRKFWIYPRMLSKWRQYTGFTVRSQLMSVHPKKSPKWWVEFVKESE